jgi:hypothetical protein
MRYAQENMRREDLECLIGPFVQEYLPGHFPQGGTPFGTWLGDLDRRVEDALGRPTNDFGDTLVSLEIGMPASTLAAWLRPLDEAELRRASMNVSRALQRAAKRLLLFHYTRNQQKLYQNMATAAVLFSCSVPGSTWIDVVDGKLVFDTDRDVYWDHVSGSPVRRQLLSDPRTHANLAANLERIKRRLLGAGEEKRARFFEASEQGDFIKLVSDASDPNPFLNALFRLEADMVRRATTALRKCQEFLADADTAPGRAVETLAELGEAITRSFNNKMFGVFGSDAVRPLGSLLFLEATRALDPQVSPRPLALLSLTVLKDEREYDLAGWLEGREPERADVAVGARLLETGEPS